MLLAEIAEKLHLTLCNRKHNDHCKFYSEESWEDPDHFNWIQIAENFRKTSGFSEERILENMNLIIVSVSRIAKAIDGNQVLEKYAKELLKIL